MGEPNVFSGWKTERFEHSLMKNTHYLAPLFEPDSVAVIGATERPGAIGAVLICRSSHPEALPAALRSRRDLERAIFLSVPHEGSSQSDEIAAGNCRLCRRAGQVADWFQLQQQDDCGNRG